MTVMPHWRSQGCRAARARADSWDARLAAAEGLGQDHWNSPASRSSSCLCAPKGRPCSEAPGHASSPTDAAAIAPMSPSAYTSAQALQFKSFLRNIVKSKPNNTNN